jgi:ADP-heptose:LPS heptosyltransferase
LNFDVCLDSQSLTKSSMLGWITGARHRIGFGKPQGRELALVLNNIRVTPTRSHVVEKYLELTGPLGVPHSDEAHFDLDEGPREVIDRFLYDAHLTGDFAVINPGAGWDSKLWPARRFAKVARHLGEVHQLPTAVCWAGDEEQTWAEQIVAGSGGHALLAPPTSLPELASLMRRATICVGSDTGPLHLAAAVDTPCVGLYGPTRPSVCGPYGKRHINVQAYLQQGSGRERRGSRNDAMLAIESKLVQSACDQLLQRIRTAHAA